MIAIIVFSRSINRYKSLGLFIDHNQNSKYLFFIQLKAEMFGLHRQKQAQTHSCSQDGPAETPPPFLFLLCERLKLCNYSSRPPLRHPNAHKRESLCGFGLVRSLLLLSWLPVPPLITSFPWPASPGVKVVRDR